MAKGPAWREEEEREEVVAVFEGGGCDEEDVDGTAFSPLNSGSVFCGCWLWERGKAERSGSRSALSRLLPDMTEMV